MKKTSVIVRVCLSMKSWIIALFCCFGSLAALPTVVPDPIACLMDLETHFFVEPIVNQGLSLYDIRQELWIPINISLQQKSRTVPDRMKKETAFMVPNPIEYPMQRLPTATILKKVLFEVFLEAMDDYWVNERPRSDNIFAYIFSQQFPRFTACFGEEVRELNNK